MTIHLHIDTLVLDGMPVEAGDAESVRAAAIEALKRLLATGAGVPGLRSGGARASVPADDIRLTEGQTPAALGRQIGQAVYGGISR